VRAKVVFKSGLNVCVRRYYRTRHVRIPLEVIHLREIIALEV
jgi:hypothetical protein